MEKVFTAPICCFSIEIICFWPPKRQTKLFLYWNITPNRGRCVQFWTLPFCQCARKTAQCERETAGVENMLHAAPMAQTDSAADRMHRPTGPHTEYCAMWKMAVWTLCCIRSLWFDAFEQIKYDIQLKLTMWTVSYSFPLVTHDWPRHTHTQTWQSSENQSLSYSLSLHS